MKGNRICEMLGIKYPIIQAPMAWICGPELAAAVSEAGGLGCIAINSGLRRTISEPAEAGEFLRTQIRETRRLTSKPFAVNLVVGRGRFRVYSDTALEVAIQEKIPAAIMTYLAEDDPKNYTQSLKSVNTKVIYRPITCNQKTCKEAQSAGADAVIVTGFEAGGHSGPDELTTYVLVPSIANSLDIPILAGGGIITGSSLLAAFALGAEGVYIGTRFLCTTECLAHPNIKQAVLDATDTSTVTFMSPNGLARAMKNKLSEEVISLIRRGGTVQEVENVAYRGNVRRALIDGDIETGFVTYGAAAPLVRDIPGAKEIVERLVKECKTILVQLYENVIGDEAF